MTLLNVSVLCLCDYNIFVLAIKSNNILSSSVLVEEVVPKLKTVYNYVNKKKYYGFDDNNRVIYYTQQSYVKIYSHTCFTYFTIVKKNYINREITKTHTQR